MGFAILAVSTAAIFIRFAQQEASSPVIAAYRLGIAALILSPMALLRKRSELARFSRQEWILSLLSGLFLAFHFATWITSLEYTTVASSVVLVTTTPLWVALLSPIFLGERLSRPVLVGMLVALLGGTIIGLSDTCSLGPGGIACPPLESFIRGQAFLGDFLALSGAWMAAGYLLVGRRLRSSMSLLTYTFVVYGAAALVLFGLAIGFGQPLTGYSVSTYGWLFALAVIPQLIGHSTFNWALRHVPAGSVSVFLLGEPIGSTLLALIILQEIPGPIKLVGAGFILLGIWMASREKPARN